MTVIRETIERYVGQTVEDLAALPEGTLAELIDGEIIMSPSPNRLHRHVVQELFLALAGHVRARKSGQLFLAPFDVHLSEQYVFQPDIIFIARERVEEVLGEFVYGSPDLVIEILSPSTAYYDLTKKREAYEAFGVKEYWIVDPERNRVEILVHDKGAYRTDQVVTGRGRARSVLLAGLEVDIEPLFEHPGK
jgi:Uma2 family endonuclease